MKRQPQHIIANGFTLIELLVALFVFGLLASAGVYLLRSSADGQAVLSARLEENGEIVRAAVLLRADLAHALDRPARAAGGAPMSAFVAGGSMPGGLFAFTTLSAPLEEAGSEVERVGYAHADGVLIRYVWAMPDGGGEPDSARITEKIANVAVRYRDGAGQWSQSWTPAPGDGLPRAVELTLTDEAGVPTRIVAPVGPQQRRPVLEPSPEEAEGAEPPAEEVEQ